MFDLEQALAEWRRRMHANGIRTPEYLNELESHLRDDLEQQRRAGLNLEEAFASASARIGKPAALQSEFSKLGKWNKAAQTIRGILLTPIWLPVLSPDRMKRAAMALAGIPGPYGPENLPGPNIEPRWATYARAAALLGPALFLWAVATVIVAPKLREVCLSAGFQGDEEPQFIRQLFGAMGFLLQHWMMVAGAIVVMLILLEWRSRRWPLYRRAVLGAGAFLLNLAVLLFISLMGLLAVIAASKLMALAK